MVRSGPLLRRREELPDVLGLAARHRVHLMAQDLARAIGLAAHAVDAEVRVYDLLFAKEDPLAAPEGQDFTASLNPNSLTVLTGCKVEAGLAASKPGDRFQFLRQGYFCVDADSTPEKPVFNRSVTLRDSWAKIERSQQEK